MTNTLKLKLAIMKKGLKRKEIASYLGISQYSLHRKINNKTEFKASEIHKLSTILKIRNDELGSIFFDESVDYKSTYD